MKRDYFIMDIVCIVLGSGFVLSETMGLTKRIKPNSILEAFYLMAKSGIVYLLNPKIIKMKKLN